VREGISCYKAKQLGTYGIDVIKTRRGRRQRRVAFLALFTTVVVAFADRRDDVLVRMTGDKDIDVGAQFPPHPRKRFRTIPWKDLVPNNRCDDNG